VWAKALEVASHVTHRVAVAAVALVLAGYLFSIAIKKRQSAVTWSLVAVILLLGLAPLLSSAYLQSRGLYIVRVSYWELTSNPSTIRA
jgi:hypothetical protein